jgi:hypothetical protein
MRALTILASLGTVLIVSASPAEAGGRMHGGTTVTAVVGSHHGGARFAFHQGFFRGPFAVPTFPNGIVPPLATLPGVTRPFGTRSAFGTFGGDFGGTFGGFDYGPLDYGNASPTVTYMPAYTPPGVPQLTPPPTRVAANLPPCHEETPSGVIVDRGTGCSRAPQ